MKNTIEKTFKKCTCAFNFDEYAEAPSHAVLEIDKNLYLEIKKQQEAMEGINCYSMQSFQYITKWGECDTSGEADIDLFTENEEYRVDTSLLVVTKEGRVLVKAYEKFSGLSWETEPFYITELDEFFTSYGNGQNRYRIRQQFTILQDITVYADDEQEALEIAEVVDCYSELMDNDFPICDFIEE